MTARELRRMLYIEVEGETKLEQVYKIIENSKNEPQTEKWKYHCK